MFIAIVWVFVGLALLTAGAEGFVRGAAALAFRLGLSKLVVGLTVVAFGTSAPELLVCLKAAVDGQTSLAVGNAVGSNIFNTGAILGIAALIFPISVAAVVVRREVPIMIVTGFLLLGAIWLGGQELERWAGAVFLLLWLGYLYYTYQAAKKERPEVLAEHHLELAPDDARAVKGTPIWRDVVYLGAGLALLVLGADRLVAGAVDLARLAGVSELVIGLTVVAAGTGLPELATSVVAAVRKHPDIAVGNVLGSNIFNIILILGATAFVTPLAIEPIVVRRDIFLMLVLFFLCFPLMKSRGHISRLEGGLLLAIYGGYLAWLIHEARASSS